MSIQHHINLKQPLRRFVPARPLGWGLLSLFVPLMLLFAFQMVHTDPDIEQAHTWFAQQHPTPKFFDAPVSPDWANARKVTHDGKKFYEVPLQESTVIKFGIGNFDGQLNAQNSALSRANGKLRIVIAQNGATYKAFFLQTSGTKTYVDANGESKVFSTNFDHIEPDFTGTMEYFDMDSKHVDGWYFEQGVAQKLVFTFKRGNKPAALDRCLTCTETTTFWQIVVSTGGYVNTYWEISQTVNCSAPTVFYCYDPPFYPPGYYYYPWGNYTTPPITPISPVNPIEPSQCSCNNTAWSGVWRERSWDLLGFMVRTGLKTTLKDIKCRTGSFGYDFNSYSFVRTPEGTEVDATGTQVFGNATVTNQELIQTGPGACDWFFRVRIHTKAVVIVLFPPGVATRIGTASFNFTFEYDDTVDLR